MVESVKGLRRPILTEVNGQRCVLYTSGWVAHVLQRTPWTIRWWQRKGLFPEPPFHINPDHPQNKRGLYPAEFLEALAEIAGRPYFMERLDHYDWKRFYNDVSAAWEATVVPLLGTSVIETGDLTVLRSE